MPISLVGWRVLARELAVTAMLVTGWPCEVPAQGLDGGSPPPTSSGTAAAPSLRSAHVRPLKTGSFDASALLSEAVRRSETVRGLVASLEASDVIVWIAVEDVRGLRTGRLRVMGAAGGFRRVYVEIARASHVEDQIAWLGHELWHGLEIAEAPEVVDQAALERFYRRIGDRMIPGESAFETGGAVDAGRQVSRELRLAGRSR